MLQEIGKATTTGGCPGFGFLKLKSVQTDEISYKQL